MHISRSYDSLFINITNEMQFYVSRVLREGGEEKIF